MGNLSEIQAASSHASSNAANESFQESEYRRACSLSSFPLNPADFDIANEQVRLLIRNRHEYGAEQTSSRLILKDVASFVEQEQERLQNQAGFFKRIDASLRKLGNSFRNLGSSCEIARLEKELDEVMIEDMRNGEGQAGVDDNLPAHLKVSTDRHFENAPLGYIALGTAEDYLGAVSDASRGGLEKLLGLRPPDAAGAGLSTYGAYAEVGASVLGLLQEGSALADGMGNWRDGLEGLVAIKKFTSKVKKCVRNLSQELKSIDQNTGQGRRLQEDIRSLNGQLNSLMAAEKHYETMLTSGQTEAKPAGFAIAGAFLNIIGASTALLGTTAAIVATSSAALGAGGALSLFLPGYMLKQASHRVSRGREIRKLCRGFENLPPDQGPKYLQRADQRDFYRKLARSLSRNQSITSYQYQRALFLVMIIGSLAGIVTALLTLLKKKDQIAGKILAGAGLTTAAMGTVFLAGRGVSTCLTAGRINRKLALANGVENDGSPSGALERKATEASNRLRSELLAMAIREEAAKCDRSLSYAPKLLSVKLRIEYGVNGKLAKDIANLGNKVSLASLQSETKRIMRRAIAGDGPSPAKLTRKALNVLDSDTVDNFLSKRAQSLQMGELNTAQIASLRRLLREKEPHRLRDNIATNLRDEATRWVMDHCPAFVCFQIAQRLRDTNSKASMREFLKDMKVPRDHIKAWQDANDISFAVVGIANFFNFK